MKKFSEEEIETVIKYVQQFEPSGIAARNLKECLLIQLEESAIDTGLKRSCIDIIENYFEELRLRNYEKIGKDLKLSRDKVVNAFEHILKLNPKPGYNEFEEDHNLIYPDLIVTKKRQRICNFTQRENITKFKNQQRIRTGHLRQKCRG